MYIAQTLQDHSFQLILPKSENNFCIIILTYFFDAMKNVSSHLSCWKHPMVFVHTSKPLSSSVFSPIIICV